MARLESVYTSKAYRGFESPSFRKTPRKHNSLRGVFIWDKTGVSRHAAFSKSLCENDIWTFFINAHRISEINCYE